jgi:hypothetical protein
MKTMKTQRGMTLTSFLVVAAVVGFALYVGMKLFPMYQEYYSVKAALKGVSQEPGVAGMEPGQVQQMFFRRLYINYSENVKPENVKMKRINGGWDMQVNYEVRRELIGNLDVVGKFETNQELTFSGAQ